MRQLNRRTLTNFFRKKQGIQVDEMLDEEEDKEAWADENLDE